MSRQNDFPQLSARTQRFTLGVPRNFTITEDGRHVIFLRSKGHIDPINCLWQIEVDTGIERLLVDPQELWLAEEGGGSVVASAELARRERARESARGIVAYSTDSSGRVLTFTLGGELFVADATNAGEIRRIDLTSLGDGEDNALEAGVFDPRLSPDARHVSFVVGNSLWVAPAAGQGLGWQLLPVTSKSITSKPITSKQGMQTVSWGSAEFIAAEEMGRNRGHWWSPDSDALAVARVDVSSVQQWHIADPANPDKAPRVIRYPAAGTTNALVELYVVKMTTQQTPLKVNWDTEAFPYLCDVNWSGAFGLTLVLQSRDQREMRILLADPDTGETSMIAMITDPDWVEIVPGAPAHSPIGLLTVGEHHVTNSYGGTRAIALNGEPITSPDEWVRAIVGVSWSDTNGPKPDGTSREVSNRVEVAYLSSETQDNAGLCSIALRSVTISADDPPVTLTQRTELSQPNGAAVTTAFTKAGICVVGEASLEDLTRFTLRDGQGAEQTITSYGADPFEALGYDNMSKPWQVEMCVAGDTEVPVAILWPQQPSNMPLPILLDPYGGPGAQRVLNARNMYAQSQWFANQGYCVVIADGRGTPARGGSWRKVIKGDLARCALQDQLTALDFVLKKHAKRVDHEAVAIRGWSFGGYLAALAVLRCPERFHAAIAGAPVTDWALYDTHYTERYLGEPKKKPENYRRSSLLEDRPEIQRPIMLIHGMADDNVVAAHTLQLSSVLLAAGHPHEVLPLTGVTHMTPQPVVAENLLLAQSKFLRRQLALRLDGS